MSEQTKTARRIASALFVSLFLLWGSGYNTFGVFFPPLLKEFHGTHASISLCATAIVLFTGAAAPIAGWLIKLIDVRLVMGAGATLAGVSLFGISGAASFNHLLMWYVLLGFGLGGSTMVPASLILTELVQGAARHCAWCGNVGHGTWRDDNDVALGTID